MTKYNREINNNNNNNNNVYWLQVGRHPVKIIHKEEIEDYILYTA